MPGVGSNVALTAIAVFSDVRRVPGARHAASYAGLVPRPTAAAAVEDEVGSRLVNRQSMIAMLPRLLSLSDGP